MKQGVGLGKLYYASLSQLISIARHSTALGPVLKDALGRKWPDVMDRLYTYTRHPLAHPGKMLVAKPADICRLHDDCAVAVSFLLGLGERERRVTTPAGWQVLNSGE
jgi:hypothetical protein